MNPTTKPTDNYDRPIHGGTWSITSATNVRAAFRGGVTPTNRGIVIGFRCALRVREPRDPSKVGL